MKIIRCSSLSDSEKLEVLKLWNNEYPAKLAFESTKELDKYLNDLKKPSHLLLIDSDRKIKAWYFDFIRDHAKWFAIILDASIHGQGWGSRILNIAKEKELELNGWVIDHNRDVKRNGDIYKSPLNFYIQHGFKKSLESRLELETISAAKIRWRKTDRIVTIRQEKEEDFENVFKLIEKAFETEKYSDHKEQFLVERLRTSEAFIPELSLVAEIEGKVVGHILLTKVKIKNKTNEFDSLALAPVSVLPEFQGEGIGGKLIVESHKKAKELGYQSIVLLGHEQYYPRFGYERADKHGIELPFEVPKENCMVIALTQNGLNGISGIVEYPKAFST